MKSGRALGLVAAIVDFADWSTEPGEREGGCRLSWRPVRHGHKVLGVPEIDMDDGEGRAAVELAEQVPDHEACGDRADEGGANGHSGDV